MGSFTSQNLSTYLSIPQASYFRCPYVCSQVVFTKIPNSILALPNLLCTYKQQQATFNVMELSGGVQELINCFNSSAFLGLEHLTFQRCCGPSSSAASRRSCYTISHSSRSSSRVALLRGLGGRLEGLLTRLHTFTVVVDRLCVDGSEMEGIAMALKAMPNLKSLEIRR